MGRGPLHPILRSQCQLPKTYDTMSTLLPHGPRKVQRTPYPDASKQVVWENEVIAVDGNVCHTPKIDASIPNAEVMTPDHVVYCYHDTRRLSMAWAVEPDKPLNDSYSSDPLSNNINLDAPGTIKRIYPHLTCMLNDGFCLFQRHNRKRHFVH